MEFLEIWQGVNLSLETSGVTLEWRSLISFMIDSMHGILALSVLIVCKHRCITTQQPRDLSVGNAQVQEGHIC